MLEYIIKRDGREVKFDRSKIENAIRKAIRYSGEEVENNCEKVVTDSVIETLKERQMCAPTIEEIQETVVETLLKMGLHSIAMSYETYRRDRTKIRDGHDMLMDTMMELTYGKSSDVEIKRENANIDGGTAMGTMLQYGCEVSRQFNLERLMPSDFARAHRAADIHIHDLDFYALTETCIVEDTSIIVRLNGTDVKVIKAKQFEEELETDVWKELEDMEILSGGHFTKLIRAVKHSSEGKRVLRFNLKDRSVSVTSDHKMLANKDGEFDVYKASEIAIGDEMIVHTLVEEEHETSIQKVESIEEVEYDGLVYDFETGTHYFNANGVMVHNCCQIDLEKLFAGGFGTGHGYVREPKDIRSYGALACIALQCNQNEMHKSV